VGTRRYWGIVAGSLTATLFVSGCAATAPPKAPPVFFPPAPALPRIQYLTHFSGKGDVETQSRFDRFVVGEMQDRQLDKPYGVGMHDGKIYVCDTNATVTVFDLKERTFSFLKGASGAGVLRQPVNISITPDGTKYVSDPVRGQVVAFGADDSYLRAYGAPGDWKPVDAVAFENRLYVADVRGSEIVVFDRDSGEKVASFGKDGEPSARLDRPTNLAFDAQGFLYVTDLGRFQVVKLDRDGRFVANFGKLGDNLGHFARPKGIAVARDGLVYAVDAAFNNVQIFMPTGRLATYFGGPGQEPGLLTLPAKVALDYDNVELFRQYVEPNFEAEYLILVTSQFGPRRLNVFAYGQERGKAYPTEEGRGNERQARPAE
jgi:DNA-binding beta-propeller fold protein YncE